MKQSNNNEEYIGVSQNWGTPNHWCPHQKSPITFLDFPGAISPGIQPAAFQVKGQFRRDARRNGSVDTSGWLLGDDGRFF